MDTEKAIALARHFEGRIKTTMGIGTHLTNDVGPSAPNHVIKIAEMDCGNGPVPLLKLSDDLAKTAGAAEAVADAMKSLNIPALSDNSFPKSSDS